MRKKVIEAACSPVIWKLYIIAFMFPSICCSSYSTSAVSSCTPRPLPSSSTPFFSGTFRIMYHLMKWNKKKKKNLHCHHVLDCSSYVKPFKRFIGSHGRNPVWNVLDLNILWWCKCSPLIQDNMWETEFNLFFYTYIQKVAGLYSCFVSMGIYGCSPGTVTGENTLL